MRVKGEQVYTDDYCYKQSASETICNRQQQIPRATRNNNNNTTIYGMLRIFLVNEKKKNNKQTNNNGINITYKVKQKNQITINFID